MKSFNDTFTAAKNLLRKKEITPKLIGDLREHGCDREGRRLERTFDIVLRELDEIDTAGLLVLQAVGILTHREKVQQNTARLSRAVEAISEELHKDPTARMLLILIWSEAQRQEQPQS